MSFFEHVTVAPMDAIFGLTRAFNEDPRQCKVNLTVGLYKNEELQTPILNCVKKAEKELLQQETSKQYLPLEGDPAYLEEIGELVFGTHFWKQSKERVAKVQTVGGTNALRIGGEFLLHEKICEAIHLPDPTWPNHKGVFTRCGLSTLSYSYYDKHTRARDFEKMYTHLNRLPSRSVVLLHACCHNPTGADLTYEEWKMLSDLFLEKKFLPFFDLAYQGFDQNVEADAAAVRLFARAGHEMLLAYSLSKSFSLYSERVGALFIIGETHKACERIVSRLISCVRPNYSNPPKHGARIVAAILRSQERRKEWEFELAKMRERVKEMRIALAQKLIAKDLKIDFNFLLERVGLFSFSGLNELQVDRLIKEYGVYMTNDGRMNIAGLTWNNLDYVVESIVGILRD